MEFFLINMPFFILCLYIASLGSLGLSGFFIVEGLTEQFEFFTFNSLLYVSLQDTWQTIGAFFFLFGCQAVLLASVSRSWQQPIIAMVFALSCLTGSQLLGLCCYVDSFNFFLLMTQLPEYLPKLGEFTLEYVIVFLLFTVSLFFGHVSLFRHRPLLLVVFICVIVNYPVQSLYICFIVLAALLAELYYYSKCLLSFLHYERK